MKLLRNAQMLLLALCWGGMSAYAQSLMPPENGGSGQSRAPSLTQAPSQNHSQNMPQSLRCSASTPDEEAALIYTPLQPYVSPLDQVEEGEEEAAPIDPQMRAELMARDNFYKARHYANQLTAQRTVFMPYERYMTLTQESDQAMRIYESRLVILFPNCQHVRLLNGALFGDIKMPFDVLIGTMERAQAADHQQIIGFLVNHATPLPLSVGEILDVAARDHNVPTAAVRAFLPDDLVTHFFGDEISARKLGEAQVLTFLFKGGEIADADRRIVVVLPKKTSGINELFNAMTLTADGRFRRYVDLDPALLGRILGQWQVDLKYLILSELQVPSRAACMVDLAGKWQQGSGPDAVSFCPFYSLAEDMLKQGSYRQTRDYRAQQTVFAVVTEMLDNK